MYSDLVQYQKHCIKDNEHLDTEQQLECAPCASVFALKEDYFNHLRDSSNHNGNVKFAKALIDFSRANDADPGLSHPVPSRKPDFSVGLLSMN
jgi:uncharacterized C2H2 Zn-finger protein